MSPYYNRMVKKCKMPALVIPQLYLGGVGLGGDLFLLRGFSTAISFDRTGQRIAVYSENDYWC